MSDSIKLCIELIYYSSVFSQLHDRWTPPLSRYLSRRPPESLEEESGGCGSCVGVPIGHRTSRGAVLRASTSRQRAEGYLCEA